MLADLLESKSVQCFKCQHWKFGHLKNWCTSETDFSRLCFRCGKGEHAARSCNLPPQCKICIEDGKEANHRLGSIQCTAEKVIRKAGTTSRTMTVHRAENTQRKQEMELADD